MNTKRIFFLISLFSILATSCSQKGKPLTKEELRAERIQELRLRYGSGNPALWPEPFLDSLINKAEFRDIGVLPRVKYPDGNKYSRAKYELGKLLFHDPRMSVSEQVACASCHDPQLGWGDGRGVAVGHDRQTGSRNAMTLFNVAFYDSLFWDGRAVSLEHQATMPIEDPVEMHDLLENVVDKIAGIKGYEKYFQAAYGSPKITRAGIVNAIATFERRIVSPKSRFDLFILGDSSRLSDDEVLGLHLFRTKARCINCHNTPLFSDNKFHNDGQTLFGSRGEDLGRYKVTKNLSDVGKFRTPSLRETANTGPWMHHGNFPSLRDVILFYNLGNPAPIQRKYTGTKRDSLLPVTSPLLQKLNLTEREVQALEAFLGSITTTPRRMSHPSLPQ